MFLAVTGLGARDQQARLRIRGLPEEVVLEASNRWEAMRRLPAGRHRVQLALTGDRVPDRVTVRRIPELLYTQDTGTPDWEWHERHWIAPFLRALHVALQWQKPRSSGRDGVLGRHTYCGHESGTAVDGPTVAEQLRPGATSSPSTSVAPQL